MSRDELDVGAVPVLAGWLTMAEAAAELGISREAVHKQVATGVYRPYQLRRLGTRGPTRASLLLSAAAVRRVKERRESA